MENLGKDASSKPGLRIRHLLVRLRLCLASKPAANIDASHGGLAKFHGKEVLDGRWSVLMMVSVFFFCVFLEVWTMMMVLDVAFSANVWSGRGSWLGRRPTPERKYQRPKPLIERPYLKLLLRNHIIYVYLCICLQAMDKHWNHGCESKPKVPFFGTNGFAVFWKDRKTSKDLSSKAEEAEVAASEGRSRARESWCKVVVYFFE